MSASSTSAASAPRLKIFNTLWQSLRRQQAREVALRRFEKSSTLFGDTQHLQTLYTKMWNLLTMTPWDPRLIDILEEIHVYEKANRYDYEFLILTGFSPYAKSACDPTVLKEMYILPNFVRFYMEYVQYWLIQFHASELKTKVSKEWTGTTLEPFKLEPEFDFNANKRTRVESPPAFSASRPRPSSSSSTYPPAYSTEPTPPNPAAPRQSSPSRRTPAAAPAPPPRPSPEAVAAAAAGATALAARREAARKQRLREEFTYMDFYQVLGVRRTDTCQDIKTEKRQTMQRMHPDKYVDPVTRKRPTPEEQPRINSEFQRYNNAYRTLTNPETRLKYDSVIQEPLPPIQDVYNGPVLARKGLKKLMTENGLLPPGWAN